MLQYLDGAIKAGHADHPQRLPGGRWTKSAPGQTAPTDRRQTPPPPVARQRSAWLHAEMLKTRLAHGFCAPPQSRWALPLRQHLRTVRLSSSPTQRPPRRSVRNSTTIIAPAGRWPTGPAAGTTKPPDMSAVAASLDQHLERLRRHPLDRPVCLTPGREGPVNAALVQGTSLDERPWCRTPHAPRQTSALAPSRDHQQAPSSKARPRPRPGRPAGPQTTVLFSVEPSQSPTGFLAPSAVMASATHHTALGPCAHRRA